MVCQCEDVVLFTTASRFLPHSQRLLHSTARLYVLPEGKRCEGDGPFARPGLCEGQAWWWGVTGVGSAGIQMQGHEGSHSVLSHANARVANCSSPSSVGVDLDPRLLHVIDVLLLSHSGHTHGPCTASPQASGAWRARLNRYASILDDLASKSRRKRNTQALGHGREGRV